MGWDSCHSTALLDSNMRLARGQSWCFVKTVFVRALFSADAFEGAGIEIPVTAFRKVDGCYAHLPEQKAT